MAWNPNVPTVTNRVQEDLNAIRENFQHLDQSRIVEMGSNSNGTYVRWENGLQVCFGNVTTSISQDTLWTLPAAFINSGWVFSSGVGAAFGSGIQVVTFESRTTSNVTLRVFNALGNRVTGSAFIIAIGRWK